MSEQNETLVDLAKAVGFVLAVVLGGLFIAGVVDGYNEARDDAEVVVDDTPRESD